MYRIATSPRLRRENSPPDEGWEPSAHSHECGNATPVRIVISALSAKRAIKPCPLEDAERDNFLCIQITEMLTFISAQMQGSHPAQPWQTASLVT